MQNTKDNSTIAITNTPLEYHLNDDLKFLINCCKTTPTKEDIKAIRSYLNAEHLEISTLIGLANQHGILPLIYKTIKNLSSSSSLNADRLTLNAFLTELKPLYMSIAQRNMLMTSELIKIMHFLKENNIEALAFKGPTLSQMAYEDITLRQYVDLDVLVRKEDIYKIDTLLKECGYQRVIKLTANQERLWLILKHDLGLYHPKSGVHFEMHWSLLDEDYPIQMDQSALWVNPQTIKINQQEIKTFPTEDLLLYLCIHGSTHLWERIEWIKDIDLLLRTEDVNWDKIIKKAEGSNVETILYLGIYLAHRLFSTELPAAISKRIYHDNKLAALSDYIIKNWQGDNAKGISGTLHRTFAMLRLFPDTKARLSYLHKITLKPTLNEYSVIDLPKGLYWFYYLVRPYLLIKKYLTKQDFHD